MLTKMIKVTALLAVLFLLSACATFYKVRSVNTKNNSYLEPLNRYDNSKYQFVLHSSDLMWGMENVEIYPDRISGKYAELDPKEVYYYHNLKHRSSSRVPLNDTKYIYQVHVYANRFSQNNGIINVTDKDIIGVNVYNINEGLTTLSMVGTASFTALAAIGTFLAIACGCPHVHTYDGDTYRFNSGMFTGAVAPKLERFDYKLLPDPFPRSDTYHMMITSDENEKQYINNMELMVVNHDKNTSILPDQSGRIYTISSPQLPISISNDSGDDISYITSSQDDFSYNFSSIAESGFSNVYATFKTDEQKQNGKLILTLNNTLWGGYVYDKFSNLFGWYHDNWVKKNQRKTSEEMKQDIKEQGITLTVSVKTDEKWNDIETIELVGDATYNTLVIPIDKKWITDAPLEIRLQSGFMFWQIDYLALDNTPEKPLEISVPELKVIHEGQSAEIKTAIDYDDNNYLQHISKSDSTYIEFEGLVSKENMERTLILKSKGYYTTNPEKEGKLHLAELMKLKQPAGLSRYSKELYDQYFDDLAINH